MSREIGARRKGLNGAREDEHIDRSHGTVSDGAAESTGKGETGVQIDTGELLGLEGLDVLDDGVDLGRAGGLRAGSHCERVSDKD